MTARKTEPTLAEYKAQVREAAIRVAKENNLCREGLNKELKALGLAPVEKTYKSSFWVEFTVTGGTKTAAKEAILAAAQALTSPHKDVPLVVEEIESIKVSDVYLVESD